MQDSAGCCSVLLRVNTYETRRQGMQKAIGLGVALCLGCCMVLQGVAVSCDVLQCVDTYETQRQGMQKAVAVGVGVKGIQLREITTPFYPPVIGGGGKGGACVFVRMCVQNARNGVKGTQL